MISYLVEDLKKGFFFLDWFLIGILSYIENSIKYKNVLKIIRF